MPTNQQRRDAAKRKLERQLVRREERLKSRRQRTIIASVIVGVIVVAGAVWFITKKPSPADTSASGDTSTSASESTPAVPCVYTDTSEASVKAVSKPDNTNPLTTGTVDTTITLNQGALPVTLDRALAPCAVNAFVSLAAQKFYDNTDCTRITTDANFKILQCGDPSGTGRGGPGYSYPGETNPEVTADPTGTTSTDPTSAPAVDQYPVGTLAMANTAVGGPNGSQFFIVYGTSDLGSSGYTKIGTVSADGLAVIDQIAAKGTVANAGGIADKPAEAVTVTSISVPDDALVATQPPAPESSGATDTAGTDVLPTDAGTVSTETGTTGSTETSDTSATDTGATDTGSTDSGASDTGSTDSGTTDSVSTEAPTSAQ